MSTVTSKDGTTIGYSKVGSGPALILVDGAFCYRGMGGMPDIAKALSPHFTVYFYDRRGRGESGNTLPYAVEREVEDIAALIQEAGGSASLFGASSGAALALEAASRGLTVPKLAIYEPPFIVDHTRQPLSRRYLQDVKQWVKEGKNSQVVKSFMQVVEVPGFAIWIMRLTPVWKKMTAIAHTLPYDFTILEGLQYGEPIPAGRWAGATMPTLVLDGGKSPQWMRNGVKAASEVLPNAEYHTLGGQTHMVQTKVLAPVLIEFFKR